MKKLILCGMVVAWGSAQVEAKSSFVESIKSKSERAKVLALYAWSFIREPNEEKIKKALVAKEEVEKFTLSLDAGLGVEEGLLQNIQKLGYDKHNAMSAWSAMEKYDNAIQAVVGRYSSVFAPWNKSEDMALAAKKLLPSLQLAKMYKAYFASHKDCLRGWELTSRYANIALVDIADATSCVSAISCWYKNTDEYSLMKSVDKLSADVSFIKSCLTRKLFKQSYPVLHEQFSEYLVILDAILFHVQGSSEYASEYFYKNKKTGPPSKKEDASVGAKTTTSSVVAAAQCINHEEMIRRTDPFENNPY